MKQSFNLSVFALTLLLASCCNKTVKVACVGDSITEGAGIAVQSSSSYPVQLEEMLDADYSVVNCGQSGTTLLKKGDSPYWNCNEFHNVFSFRPNIIVINLGTNDSKPQNWNAENFVKDYQALIDTFSTITGKPKIYLCFPVPPYKTQWGINDSTITAGVIPAIRQVAKTNNLPIIDLYAALSNASELFPDAIHPNEKGAAKMAEIIAKELKK